MTTGPEIIAEAIRDGFRELAHILAEAVRWRDTPKRPPIGLTVNPPSVPDVAEVLKGFHLDPADVPKVMVEFALELLDKLPDDSPFRTMDIDEIEEFLEARDGREDPEPMGGGEE